jgi:hypothetical protein
MSLYGSSPFNFSGFTLTAFEGNVGPQGPIGPEGPRGNPAYGETGSTGIGVSFINFINDKINTIYENNAVVSSNAITQLNGNFVLDITGATSGQFSPLASIETLNNITKIYDEDGNTNTFAEVKRLNFKNIKTNSSPYVSLSYVGTPPAANEPSGTIKVTYNVLNLGSNTVTPGPDFRLAINNPGNIFSGYTGTTYSELNNASSFSILNAAEQLNVVAPTTVLLTGSPQLQIWDIDPTKASIFYLAGYKNLNQALLSTDYFYGHHVLIKNDEQSSSSKSFTLIFPKEFNIINSVDRLVYSTYSDLQFDTTQTTLNLFKISNPNNFAQNFQPNVIWQNDSYFCPSTKYDAVNVFAVGGRYFAVPVIYNTDLNVEANKQTSLSYTCKPTELDNFYRILFNPEFGVCCKTDCSCETTYDFLCDGYFTSGITCGGASGPCSELGACCLYSKDGSVTVDCQTLTYCNCATIASQSNLEFNWNKFTSIKKSCSDFDCKNAFYKIGACCDGNGGCSELPEDVCASISGYFNGISTKCITSNSINVCYGGFGGCCDSGVTCNPGISGSICLDQKMTYFGDGSTCGDFACAAENIPCYSIIENQILSIGDEYEDGVVVGIFNPNNEVVFGPNIFSGNRLSFSELAGITGQTLSNYLTTYDYSGYGFNQSQICSNENDSYLMIVAKHPIDIDSSKQLIDAYTNNSKFAWSSGANAWGPLVDIGSLEVVEFDINNLYVKEGYVYDSSNLESSKLSLYGNTFLTCDSARIDTFAITNLENRPIQSMTGLWTRNNGLYNTIRLSSAEFFYYNIGFSTNGATLANYTPTHSNVTAARALSIYNKAKPSTYQSASQWYIPSIDELGFIANKCKNTSEYNINSRLLEIGGTPLNDWHWTSTGSFDITNNEGILSSSGGITHGSMAWAMKIDVNGISENMLAEIKPRTEEYKIRPIKMIRCDKQYYSNTDSNFKLWNVPLLSEAIIDNQ